MRTDALQQLIGWPLSNLAVTNVTVLNVQNPQQDEEQFWQQHAALLSPHLRSELVICQHLLRALRTRTEPAAQAQVCMVRFHHHFQPGLKLTYGTGHHLLAPAWRDSLLRQL